MEKEGNPKLSEKKRKLSLEDVYRLLEQVYDKVSRNRGSLLDKILSKYRNRGGGVRLKPNPSPYEKQRYVRQLPEPKYNPKPEKPSFSGERFGVSLKSTIQRKDLFTILKLKLCCRE